ncbi:MAG: Hsp20/alpha crystallin family protein [Spirochaetales bacterium]|nr:MAG: Hsp20/alpha crystallin family protein [Spirochaetales bacterium]
MKSHDFPDLGKVMDDIFNAAEDFTSAFTDRMQFHPEEKAWMWNKEFYATYAYPPANIYMTEEKVLVFVFALAGFAEEDISLRFKGSYLVLSGALPEGVQDPEGARYFKRRLKRKSFTEQQYYVPANRFDRDAVKATYSNGLLTITIPPKDTATDEPDVTINIVNEDAPKAGKEKK